MNTAAVCVTTAIATLCQVRAVMMAEQSPFPGTEAFYSDRGEHERAPKTLSLVRCPACKACYLATGLFFGMAGAFKCRLGMI